MKTHDSVPARVAGPDARTRASTLALVAALAASALLVAGCGKKEEKATQVAAKVNGDEITVHQLNFVLQRQRIPAAGPQGDAIRRQILDRLVDEQLVVQKAEKEKLDRDPRVMQALDAARRQILTQAYVEQLADKTPRPTEAELKAYYDGKPDQFAARKVYVIQKVDVTVPAERRQAVATQLQSLASAAAVTDWLKSQNLPYNVSTTNNPSDQLGPMRAQIEGMKEGQSIARPTAQGVAALTVQSVKEDPATFEQVKPRLEQQLWNERKRDAVMNELKTLKDGAKIEYVGAFAASAPALPPGVVSVPAPSPASAAAPAPAPAPSPSGPASAAGIDPATLQKGLGIK